MNKLIILLAALTLFSSCKNDKETPIEDKKEQASSKIDNPVIREKLNEKKNTAPNQKDIASQRSQALSILNYRIQKDPQTYATIEADSWEYQFVFNKQMSKPGAYEGVWIDFKNDHTYTYGNKGKVEGSGKYSFHFDRKEILMVDDNPTKKPEEWSIKRSDDIMIMVGTATYKDNHIQMKLVKVPDSIQN